jgi:hypothetical protein
MFQYHNAVFPVNDVLFEMSVDQIISNMEREEQLQFEAAKARRIKQATQAAAPRANQQAAAAAAQK